MQVTFGNLVDFSLTANFRLRFVHRNSSFSYKAVAVTKPSEAGVVLLMPESCAQDEPILDAAHCAFDVPVTTIPHNMASDYLGTLTRSFSRFWGSDPVTVLHLAQGSKGALRKRALTRLEVAFGDDQDVYLKGVLSDPLTL